MFPPQISSFQVWNTLYLTSDTSVCGSRPFTTIQCLYTHTEPKPLAYHVLRILDIRKDLEHSQVMCLVSQKVFYCPIQWHDSIRDHKSLYLIVNHLGQRSALIDLFVWALPLEMPLDETHTHTYPVFKCCKCFSLANTTAPETNAALFSKLRCILNVNV